MSDTTILPIIDNKYIIFFLSHLPNAHTNTHMNMIKCYAGTGVGATSMCVFPLQTKSFISTAYYPHRPALVCIALFIYLAIRVLHITNK